MEGEGDTMGEGEGEEGEGEGEGQGDGEFGQEDGPGKGSGKRGQGGGRPGETPDDVGIKKSRIAGRLGKGKYMGAYWMKGEPPKGKAAAEYAEVQQAYAEEAMDALDKQKVPAAQRDFVREYFDSIRAEKMGDPK